MSLCERLEDYGDYKVLRNVITESEIEKLMKFWYNQNSFVNVQLNKWDTSSKSVTKINASNRIVDIIGIQKDELPEITEIFQSCFGCVMEDFEIEFPHYFTHYPLGGKHTLHKDFLPTFNRQWVITLLLNDNFEGGELIINGNVTPKEKWSAILYRGDLFHEVTPVSFGERFVVTECAGRQ